MNIKEDVFAEDLRELRPAGFVGEFVNYAARLTDAPAEYHLFTALTLLGAAAARVRVAYGSQPLPVALWTVLVGRSAYYRKTTAIEIARRVMAAAFPGPALPTLYGPERVHRAIRSAADGELKFAAACGRAFGGSADGEPRSPAARGNGELKFAATDAATFAATGRLLVVDDFLDVLYAPPLRRLAELGDRGGRLSLVAGAGTAQLASRLSAADLSSGFLARFCFVVPREKDRWLATPRQPSEETERALAAMLERAAAVEGTAGFEDCRAELDAWGMAMIEWLRERRGPGGIGGQIAAGLASRTEPALLKLAALLEISLNCGLRIPASRLPRDRPPGQVSDCGLKPGKVRPEPGATVPGMAPEDSVTGERQSEPGAPVPLRVSAKSFADAVRLERFLRGSFEVLVGRELGESNAAQYDLRVLARVTGQPGISRRRLQQNSHMDAATLRRVLGRLVREGRVAPAGQGRLYPAGGSNGKAETDLVNVSPG